MTTLARPQRVMRASSDQTPTVAQKEQARESLQSKSAHHVIAKPSKSVKKSMLRRTYSDTEAEELAFNNSSHNHQHSTLKACKLCAKKPLRLTAKDLHAAAAPHDLGDNGLIELIHSIRNQKLYEGGPSVELDQADDIVARARLKAEEVEEQRLANIPLYAPHDTNLYQSNLDAMGKFEWEELRIGALLGVGGFSNVSEICGFKLESDGRISNPSSSLMDGSLPMPDDSLEEDALHDKTYTRKEMVARKFLAKHAKRSAAGGDANAAANNNNNSLMNSSHRSTRSDGGGKRDSSTSNNASTTTTAVSYRYALKHLRPGLKDIYDKRTFNCAAVDLISEAHFLLNLQHPNIIKIRGFAAAGPQGYRQGNHNGYFLILDQLPETMEQRLVAWRKRVKKYKSFTRTLVSKMLLKRNRETASQKLEDILRERYHVAAEICGAMDYLHQRRMINRDLKIANIGFDVRGDVKLFDFGLSRWLPTSLLSGEKATKTALLEETFHMSAVGTKLYMAPEVQAREPYSTKADVFSFGIVLWEMLMLSDPQWNSKEAQTLEEVKELAQTAPSRMPLCPCWPEVLQQMMKRCVSPVPLERPSFAEIRRIFREDLNVVLQDDNDNKRTKDVRNSNTTEERPSYASMGSSSHHNHMGTSSHHNHHQEFGGDEEHDAIKYASDDDLPRYNKRSSRLNSSDEDDTEGTEGRDAVGELGASGLLLQGKDSSDSVANLRRRSTYVLNFDELSWLSTNSLRFSTAAAPPPGIVEDEIVNNDNKLEDTSEQRESNATTVRTSTSSITSS